MASRIDELLAGRVTVTIAEAANALGVSEKGLRSRMARRPEDIPTVRLGRRVLISSAWVQQMATMPPLAQREAQSTSRPATVSVEGHRISDGSEGIYTGTRSS